MYIISCKILAQLTYDGNGYRQPYHGYDRCLPRVLWLFPEIFGHFTIVHLWSYETVLNFKW